MRLLRYEKWSGKAQKVIDVYTEAMLMLANVTYNIDEHVPIRHL